jgi:hypothetical protein
MNRAIGKRKFYYYVLLEPWSKPTFTRETFWKWVPQHFQEVRYVGVTTRFPTLRFREHLRDYKNHKTKVTKETTWGNSRLSLGQKPLLVVIEESFGDLFVEEGMQREVELIAMLQNEDCALTNGNQGGLGVVGRSQESIDRAAMKLRGRSRPFCVIEKLRAANIGKKYSKDVNAKKGSKGESNPFYGKRHSQEVMDRIAETKRLNPIKRVKNPFYGRKHTEETKRRLSFINTGKHASPETRLKMSVSLSGERNPFYGKHHSEETRNKISLMYKVRQEKKAFK